jgi:hypothetical protein
MYRSEEDVRKASAGVSTMIADFSSKESVKRAVAGVLEWSNAGSNSRPRRTKIVPLENVEISEPMGVTHPS